MKSPVTWDDFEKLDIRVGTIIDVRDFPKARKPAWQLVVDFGPLGRRNTSAQITDLYDRGSLMNRQVIAVVNFPPKQIANFISECLVLGVYSESGEVVLLAPERKTANGMQIG